MRKQKVDVKAATIQMIQIAKSTTNSREISDLMATLGHSIAPTSVAALLAHHRI